MSSSRLFSYNPILMIRFMIHFSMLFLSSCFFAKGFVCCFSVIYGSFVLTIKRLQIRYTIMTYFKDYILVLSCLSGDAHNQYDCGHQLEKVHNDFVLLFFSRNLDHPFESVLNKLVGRLLFLPFSQLVPVKPG